MFIRSITALAVAATFAAVSAQAEPSTQTTLSAANGDVMVNQGAGFRPATAGMALHPGDRVIVTGKGRAKLHYASGCGVSLAPGSMATISTLAPCKVGLRQAGIVTVAQDDAVPPAGAGVAAGTPFGLSPGVLTLLTVGVFTLGAAGVSGAFESSSP
jgi:hypothetical protein